MIQQDGDPQKCCCAPIYERIPFLELCPPRPLLRADLRGAEPQGQRRLLFPFPAHNQSLPAPGRWDQYLQTFLAGWVPWGCWFDHVRAWWDARDEHRILDLFFEDIKQDPRGEIQKVGRFLGRELPEPVLETIVAHTSFESMRENPMANSRTLPAFVLDQAVSPFMRKGTVGDWTTQFTVAQSEWFDAEWARRMEGSDLRFRTRL